MSVPRPPAFRRSSGSGVEHPAGGHRRRSPVARTDGAVRRRARRRRLGVVVGLVIALAGVGWFAFGGRTGGGGAEPTTAEQPAAAAVATARREPAPLAERMTGALDQPLQDAAAAPLASGRALLL